MIEKKAVKIDNLPVMLNTALNEVKTPGRGKLSLRTRFAMGILKVIRRYMTEGKEEEVLRK